MLPLKIQNLVTLMPKQIWQISQETERDRYLDQMSGGGRERRARKKGGRGRDRDRGGVDKERKRGKVENTVER